MSSRSLDDLDARFRPLAEQVLTKCAAAGLDITIITTLRTPVEQAHAVASGVSWTTHSKHLPQPPDGKSLAIDLAPTLYLPMKLWNPTGALWWIIAQAGVDVGLRSGMDWNGIGLPRTGDNKRAKFDPGHLEWKP